MFSANDLNIGYWYINRWQGSSSDVSFAGTGYVDSNYVSFVWSGARPVLNLKSDIKITSGEGTPNSPYNLLFN
jgi:hypothetical protein